MTYGATDPIVVGLDGSDTAATALGWAAAEAARRGCPLDVLTVTRGTGPGRAAEQVQTVIAGYPSVHIRHIEKAGNPARMLTEASRGAAMLVVGSRGPSLVSQALLGSVSAYCAKHAECPVVIVPDRDRATDFVGRSPADLVSTLGPLL